MKKSLNGFFVLTALLTALLFAGCDNGAADDPGVVDDSPPVTQVLLDKPTAALDINGSATVTLTATVLPTDATQGVDWSSNHPEIAEVSSDGLVTAKTTGQAVITAASKGFKANGTRAEADCTVTVSDSSGSSQTQPLHWDFSTNPEGWTAASSSTAQPSDADYGNGMTLLGKTGSTDWKQDSGAGRSMAVYPEQTAPSGEGNELFTPGALRPNGQGTLAKIVGVQAPYTITVNYGSPNASATDRCPIIKIGESLYNSTGSLSTSGDAIRVLAVSYNGTDTPDILLKANNGILVFDVYITPGASDTPTEPDSGVIAVVSLTLNETAKALAVNETLTLTPTVLPSDATEQGVTWSTSAPAVATVADGVVTAVGTGEAIITATSVGNKADETKATAACTVTVAAVIIPVVSVTLNETAKTLTVNDTITLTPTVAPGNATQQGVTWSTSASGVATVEDGVVTAKSTGQAIITATSVGNKADETKATAACTVTVTAAALPRTALHWTFDADPSDSGWVTGTGVVKQPDASYGNGMILLGTSGNENGVANDSGTQHRMAMIVAQAKPGTGDDLENFTPGMLRIQGNGTFAKISGYQGPYTLKINYASTSSGTGDRYPVVKIDTTTYNADGLTSSCEAGAGKVLQVQYTGTGTPDILLKAVGGLRIFDIYITPTP